jgi:hypothetical protein
VPAREQTRLVAVLVQQGDGTVDGVRAMIFE